MAHKKATATASQSNAGKTSTEKNIFLTNIAFSFDNFNGKTILKLDRTWNVDGEEKQGKPVFFGVKDAQKAQLAMRDAWKAMKAAEPKWAFNNMRKEIDKAIEAKVITMELA